MMMRSKVAGALLASVTLIAGCAHSHDARRYFGHLQVIDSCGPKACKPVEQLLARMDGECRAIDTGCEPASQLLDLLYGKTHRRSMPDYIVWFERKDSRFVRHDPVLMWGDKNTPWLYGARDLYALVFSERPACVSAHVTTIHKNEPNPFSAVLAALGSTPAAPAATPTARTTGNVRWFPLSGDATASAMWVGTAGLSIEENSTDRIVIEYAPECDPSTLGSGEEDASTKEDAAANEDGAVGTVRITVECADPSKKCATSEATPEKEKEKQSGEFLAANGFFSNSPARYATVSFGFGVSFGVEDTVVASGGSQAAVNGYALAKIYLPGLRPRLRVSPEERGHRTSLSVFAGTGLKESFKELVFGLSLGHLIGNMGIVAGGNSIAAPADSTSGRKLCPFVGIDYAL